MQHVGAKIKELLYTRAEAMPLPVQQQFADLGIKVIQIPLIATEAVAYKKEPVNDDWLFFTSGNTVKYFDFSQIAPTVKIAAIGHQTAAALKEKGWPVDFIPQASYSESFVAEWQTQINQSQRIYFPHSCQARTVIVDELTKLGHQVTAAVIYQTIFPVEAQTALQDYLYTNQPDYAIFSSPSSWQHFYQIARKIPQVNDSFWQNLTISAIGPVTKRGVEKAGQKVSLMPDVYDMTHLYHKLLKTIASAEKRVK
ncbi:uroporphyrinogen-III synthase [Enterococcus sp. PF1-24]|uniref:uroporphyrinogen-III synthase n=1 Tax=unclassified Enterococcus TaxID=2608891 RepID=UPI00247637D6|nr:MULTISPECIES: uroporphyrinogen-III synthase [unclassified Enterococcus]MDH6363371.1 uroporphyrinogen-III synthase [Enterococcus sp. PFB1-1]MDH6400328.1 uroporphyrinogen-III synthase [Enterococcus sp. PF1-24]